MTAAPGPLECAWQGYKMMYVPAAASDTQLAETRQAFYTGATVILRVLMMIGTEQSEAEAEAVYLQLQAEAMKFDAELEARAREQSGVKPQ